METEDNLLNEFDEPAFQHASAGQRFLNYIIDVIAFYILFIIVSIIGGVAFATSNPGESIEGSAWFTAILYIESFVILIAYYTLLEGSRGKTLGKLITKTKVVSETGGQISYGKAFIRTLIRLIPVEFLSRLSGSNMWHDEWTKTMVVKDNR